MYCETFSQRPACIPSKFYFIVRNIFRNIYLYSIFEDYIYYMSKIHLLSYQYITSVFIYNPVYCTMCLFIMKNLDQNSLLTS
jgi:hypothetical protein